jgi:hypothetical protein
MSNSRDRRLVLQSYQLLYPVRIMYSPNIRFTGNYQVWVSLYKETKQKKNVIQIAFDAASRGLAGSF